MRTQSASAPQIAAQPLIAISLFSGGGGLDLGFSAAGFNVACATDIDPYSCETLCINSGKKRYYRHSQSILGDIKQLKGGDLLQRADLKSEQVRIVLGGPPCQAFSVFGRRRGVNDPRGDLVWEYLRLVQELQPEAFVFENVAGFRSIHDGELYRDLLCRLSFFGRYTVSAHLYEMADFGVPQFRKRLFFIGSKQGIKVPLMERTHGSSTDDVRPYRIVREALRELPSPDKGHLVPNHNGRTHSARIVERYRNLEFGERDPKTRINRLHPDRPSFTIIVGSDKGGGKGHIHPFAPREVTPRESARMQTFPDWWEFYGTGRHVIRQVGNAVPPLFAALLASHIKTFLFGSGKRSAYRYLINKLGLDYLRD